MQLSMTGLLICLGLLAIGRRLGSSLIIALWLSFAFGATAIATVPALGGSSPLIVSVIMLLLIGATVLRRGAFRDLARLLARDRLAALVLLLTVYVVVGAFLMPRLFAGQTTVFVASRVEGRVAELLLMPVPGNLTQTFYFVIGALSFFAFRILARDQRTLPSIQRGLVALAVAHAALGLIDLGGRMAGLGDVLAPIRSASYSMLTGIEEAGFMRITGAHAEASSYGAIALSCLAFSFTYWRATGARYALILACILLCLIAFSTSSTAYAGLLILSAALLASLLRAGWTNQLTLQDLGFLGLGGVAAVAALAVYLASESSLRPFLDLLDKMVIQKGASASAEERFYWNTKSLQSFWDTGGFGVGIGSSRASSWPIAVVSQLGVVGATVFGGMLIVLLRGLRSAPPVSLADHEAFATLRSLRAFALATIVGASISGGGADPGMTFYAAVAILLQWSRPSMQAAEAGATQGYELQGTLTART